MSFICLLVFTLKKNFNNNNNNNNSFFTFISFSFSFSLFFSLLFFCPSCIFCCFLFLLCEFRFLFFQKNQARHVDPRPREEGRD